MAWPATRASGYQPDHDDWNEIVNALSQWGGNVNGGGYTLSNVVIDTASITASSAFLIPDGVVGAPGLRFSADTDTGIHRPTADTFAVVCGGAARLTVDATGASVAGALTASGLITGGSFNTAGAIVGAGLTLLAAAAGTSIVATDSTNSTLSVQHTHPSIGNALVYHVGGAATHVFTGNAPLVTYLVLGPAGIQMLLGGTLYTLGVSGGLVTAT